MNSQPQSLGIIIVGDEILVGKRQDRHLAHVIDRLNSRGLRLAWCRYVVDDLRELTDHLRQSQLGEVPVLCFGGIGATPDDCTRQAAASAFGCPLVMHAEAVACIEAQFGEGAYPNRIRMAELPEDCLLIPNPVNRIPGFTLYEHHFLPGFPEMAWPMLEWVLENYFPTKFDSMHERSIRVLGVMESQLLPLMDAMSGRHTEVKLFSLPHRGAHNSIEIGFRGSAQFVEPAFAELLAAINAQGLKIQSAARSGLPESGVISQ